MTRHNRAGSSYSPKKKAARYVWLVVSEDLENPGCSPEAFSAHYKANQRALDVIKAYLGNGDNDATKSTSFNNRRGGLTFQADNGEFSVEYYRELVR